MARKPTDGNLRTFGAEPLTRWLIAAARDRSTITYGEAKKRLEKEYGFSTIFSPMMGKPAGKVMDAILEVEPTAPLLNVLLVRQTDGMPGEGAGYYMADYFGNGRLKQEGAREKHPAEWRDYFEQAAEDVYTYPSWDSLYERVYQRSYVRDNTPLDPRSPAGGTEKDGLPCGRIGEGKNHKALRLWVLNNPQKLFRNIRLTASETEVTLLSGDRVDVVYYAEDKTIPIEVKSRDSNEADLQRGIYQCVKYRAVLDAMDPRADPAITAILVTEHPLPGYLKELARRFGVKHIKVPMKRAA